MTLTDYVRGGFKFGQARLEREVSVETLNVLGVRSREECIDEFS